MKDENFKLLGVLTYDGQTDERTNGRTFVIVESLSRLKIPNLYMKSKSKNNVCTTVKSKSLVSGIVNL